jgi:hypothetical protein
MDVTGWKYGHLIPLDRNLRLPSHRGKGICSAEVDRDISRHVGSVSGDNRRPEGARWIFDGMGGNESVQ